MSTPVQSDAPPAVLFDLDGTLVDSERENVESVVLAVRRYGAELTDEERGFVIGHSWNEIHAMIVRNHALTVADARAHRRGGRREGGAAGQDRAPRAAGRGGAGAAAGAAGRSWRVVSGASGKRCSTRFGDRRAASCSRSSSAAEDYANGKPSPEPYLTGLAQLGAAAGRAIVIEDATPGILSARAAGIAASSPCRPETSPATICRRPTSSSTRWTR